MATKNFHLNYDPDGDVLHVVFGRAQKAVSVEQEPDLFVRHNPKTGEVVGFTVLGFKRDFLSRKQDISIPQAIAS